MFEPLLHDGYDCSGGFGGQSGHPWVAGEAVGHHQKVATFRLAEVRTKRFHRAGHTAVDERGFDWLGLANRLTLITVRDGLRDVCAHARPDVMTSC
jgi:hypothetical protein